MTIKTHLYSTNVCTSLKQCMYFLTSDNAHQVPDTTFIATTQWQQLSIDMLILTNGPML